jgi:NADPH-dependent 7-cyano-7-deazaguanine reductase QueF
MRTQGGERPNKLKPSKLRLNWVSFTTGNSTHSQRIQRLWRDVRNCFDRRYYAIFQQLERVGALDVDTTSSAAPLQTFEPDLIGDTVKVPVPGE